MLRETHRLGRPVPQRIVIVRALRGLGDILCTVPALRALRAALPDAHIALIGLPAVAELTQRFAHYIDELIEFPGFPGIPEQRLRPERIPAFLLDMQQREFDLALQLHGSGATTNSFVALLNARLSAGFYIAGNYCPDAERFLPYPPHEPEILRLLRLLEFLGIPAQGEDLEFVLRDEDRQQRQALDGAAALPAGGYVCLHPGASDPQRRWAPEHFACVADELARQGLQIVLTGGASEAELTAAVARAMHAPALDLAGKTPLGALAALLSTARLLICNDTGVSHLAAALQLPSVVIFSASDPNRWAPLDRRRHRSIGRPLLHSGCHHQGCTSDHCCRRYSCALPASLRHRRLLAATPEHVVEQALKLLQTTSPGAPAQHKEELYAA